MRIRFTFPALALLFLLGGHADTAFARRPRRDLSAEIQGKWAGKLRTKAFSLEPGGGNERAVQNLTFDIANNEGSLTIVAVYATDEGTETFNLTGVVGNSTFWASGKDEDQSETVTIAGRIVGNGTKLVGLGIETAADEVSELKFNLKKQ